MSIFDGVMEIIDEGIKGKNLGVPFEKCPKLTSYIYGTRRSTYYLYGAETGVGKTKFARDQHMFAVYDYYKKIGDDKKLDVRFIDFSMEITAKENMVNAVIRKIYKDHGKVLDYDKVIGFKDGVHLNPQERALVETKRKYFEDFEKKLVVISDQITPTFYHDVLLTHFRMHGKFAKDDGSMAVSRLGEYKPNNPQLLTVGLVDTVNLAEIEKNQTYKQSIDRISKISVVFRNLCYHTPIIIQQFNADNSDIQRQRHGQKTPMLRDFEDSKRTTKDANIVIGLWDPNRYKVETVSVGDSVYDIVQLRSWFVSAHVLKNRNGKTNIRAALRFIGAASMFEEFPEHMSIQDYTNLTKI